MKRNSRGTPGRTVGPDGTIKWRNEQGQLHRDDGPAYEYPSGGQEWYRNGKLHRDDGPARDGPRGKQWYRHGKLHREDGPAEERPDGVKLWYRRGKLHRDDGPAGEGPNGKYWFRNGKWHREDGPAIELADGRTEWFIDGVKLTPEQVAEFKERQVQAIADPFRTGLDHKTTVRPIGKLKTGSAVRKLEGEKRDTK